MKVKECRNKLRSICVRWQLVVWIFYYVSFLFSLAPSFYVFCFLPCKSPIWSTKTLTRKRVKFVCMGVCLCRTTLQEDWGQHRRTKRPLFWCTLFCLSVSLSIYCPVSKKNPFLFVFAATWLLTTERSLVLLRCNALLCIAQ